MPVGLISSMHKEIRYFRERIQCDRETVIAGLCFAEGVLGGRRVVLVESGMGKVNAALAASLLYDKFDCSLAVFCGLAGSLDPDLLAGDVVIATKLVQHDHGDILEDSYRLTQPSIPPYKPSPESVGYLLAPGLLATVQSVLAGTSLPPLSASELDRGGRKPIIHFGDVLTGDAFIRRTQERDRLQAAFGALAVEMEGAALAQVAERFGRPCLVVRSISDHAGADAHIDFAILSEEAAQNAFRIVTALLPALP